MAEHTLQRGAIPIDLDRPRTLFFDNAATWLLIQKYGKFHLPVLYTTTGSLKTLDLEFHLTSMEALEFFLFAGLQADARKHEETLTLEQAAAFLHPWNWEDIFIRVVYAVVGAHATPAMQGALGKAPADSAAAKPPAGVKAAARKTPPHPGPTRVSTSTKRSASRSRSSAGARRSSGR